MINRKFKKIKYKKIKLENGIKIKVEKDTYDELYENLHNRISHDEILKQYLHKIKINTTSEEFQKREFKNSIKNAVFDLKVAALCNIPNVFLLDSNIYKNNKEARETIGSLALLSFVIFSGFIHNMYDDLSYQAIKLDEIKKYEKTKQVLEDYFNTKESVKKLSLK